MPNTTYTIGIILGSTRKKRVSPQVGKWVKTLADERQDAQYELVDINDYNLPFYGTTSDTTAVEQWNEKLKTLDGFIFIVAEYNHSMTGALKNALDSASDNWNNKAASIVSYGSAGGVRAAEHLRNVLSELQIAHVRNHVLLSLFLDFENNHTFKPRPLHKKNFNAMLDQLLNWTHAMKTRR